MSVKPIRVGIIGCGVIAPTHIESYQKLTGVEVAWCCDIDQPKAEKLAKKYNVAKATDDLNEVYADASVDLVSICTDHAAHAEQVLLAFEAGKHVLCEKPLGATNADLDKMIAAHAAHPDLLFGGIFQHRFDGVVRCLRDMIAEDVFGKVLTVGIQLRCYRAPGYYEDYWHGTWDREGGSVLINQAIHSVDVAQWITGGVQSIMAHYENRDHINTIETEDVLTASVRYVDGSLGTFEAISASNIGWEMNLAVHGTDGAVETRTGKIMKVNFSNSDTEEKVRQQLDAANDPTGVAGKSYYGTSHPAQIADMIDAVRENRPPFVTGEMAAQTVRVVLAAYESHQTGQRVELVPMTVPV